MILEVWLVNGSYVRLYPNGPTHARRLLDDMGRAVKTYSLGYNTKAA